MTGSRKKPKKRAKKGQKKPKNAKKLSFSHPFIDVDDRARKSKKGPKKGQKGPKKAKKTQKKKKENFIKVKTRS